MDSTLGAILIALITAFGTIITAYVRRADTKLDVIHTLTNSTLTDVNKRLTLALEKIEMLEQLLTAKGHEVPTDG